MTYRQNEVARTCAICDKPILPDEWMMDLYRSSASPGPALPVEWVHENCARKAIEVFLTKRKARLHQETHAQICQQSVDAV